MRNRTLPVALATALWIGALAPGLSQKEAAPAQTGAKQNNTAKPAAPPTAPPLPPKPVKDTDVVGSVGDKKFTWADLISYAREKAPKPFQQSVAQAVGAKMADSLFGANAQKQVTLSQDDALTALRENPTQDMVRTLTFLLQDEAVRQDAAKQGVTIADTQVQDRIAHIFKDLHDNKQIPPGVSDDDFLARNNLTRPQFMDVVRQQLTAMAVIQKNVEKAQGHPFDPEDFVDARHILIRVNAQGASPDAPQPTPEQVKKLDIEARARIEKIAKEIKAGKITFDAAAKANSEDPASGRKGGELGVFTHGQMVPQFDKAAFTLKPGQVSDPIRTQFGYHLIQVVKRGKEIPQADRDTALEAVNRGKYSEYMQTVSTTYKPENVLARFVAPPRPQGAPAPQGDGE